MKTHSTLKILAIVLLAMALVSIPVSAITTITGGTIYAGDEHYNLQFLDDSNCTVFAWWAGAYGNGALPGKIIDLTRHSDVVFDISEFQGYSGIWRCYNPQTDVVSNPIFRLVVPDITAVPTPTPTPSEGNLIIMSNPTNATIYVDNIAKGITPLTVSVPNGIHVVRIRNNGYMDTITTVTVSGDDRPVSLDMIPMTPVPTSSPTTIQTTPVTTAQTTEIATVPTTEETTEETIEPPNTLVSVQSTTPNYEETIAAMQTQIANQSERIQAQEEQIGIIQQIINSILSFLGLQ